MNDAFRNLSSRRQQQHEMDSADAMSRVGGVCVLENDDAGKAMVTRAILAYKNCIQLF